MRLFVADGDNTPASRLEDVDVLLVNSHRCTVWLWIRALRDSTTLQDMYVYNRDPPYGGLSVKVCKIENTHVYRQLAFVKPESNALRVHFKDHVAPKARNSAPWVSSAGHKNMRSFLDALSDTPDPALLYSIAERLDSENLLETISLRDWLETVPTLPMQSSTNLPTLVKNTRDVPTLDHSLKALEDALKELSPTLGEIGTSITSELLIRFNEELIPLLKGTKVTLGYDRVEGIMSLMYRAIVDSYIGVDSNVPSVFESIHPFLLEHIGSAASPNGPNWPCYGRHVVRILPLTLEQLATDYQSDPQNFRNYLNMHYQYGIRLLRVKPEFANQIYYKKKNLWSTDVGLWKRHCSVVFQSGMKANRKLDLQLFKVGSPGFNDSRDYITQLLLNATVLNTHFKNIPGRSDEDLRNLKPKALAGLFQRFLESHLVVRDRDDLLWSLNDDLFEKDLVAAWPEFVARERRLENGGKDFLSSLLQMLDLKRPAKILDAAGGVGCEVDYLAGLGHEVHCNEIDERLMREATEQVERSQAKVTFTKYDWRHLDSKMPKDAFDVVLVLGNSLSCLDSPNEMKIALRGFHSVLRSGGLLAIDKRNYEDMVSRKTQMVGDDFRYPGNVIYCGSIKASPMSIPTDLTNSPKLVVLGYYRPSVPKEIGTFHVYPFGSGELEALLAQSGFCIEKVLWDFAPAEKSDAEFVTYVAVKR